MAGLGLPQPKKIRTWILFAFGLFAVIFVAVIISMQKQQKTDKKEHQIEKEESSIQNRTDRPDDIESDIEKQNQEVERQIKEAQAAKEKEERDLLQKQKNEERRINEEVERRLQEKENKIKLQSLHQRNNTGKINDPLNQNRDAELTPEERHEIIIDRVRNSSMFSKSSSNMRNDNALSSSSEENRKMLEQILSNQEDSRRKIDLYAQGVSLAEGNRLLPTQTGLPGPVDPNEVWQQNNDLEKDAPSVKLKTGKLGMVVNQGSVIPCVTLAAIKTSQPGTLKALVSTDVYDSIKGDILLIPKGSMIILKYNSGGVQAGQVRVGLIATRLIRPNGSYMNLGAFSGADSSGQSGLEDEVDTHFWANLARGFLISELAVAVHNQQNSPNGSATVTPSGQVLYQNAAGEALLETARASMRYFDSGRPTITIQAGFPLNIMVQKDLEF